MEGMLFGFETDKVVCDLFDFTIKKTMESKFAHNFTFRVIKALNSVNSKGFIHHDVKPCNILIDLKGTEFITDFGCATYAREKCK